jgi:hypothetical protein
MQWSPNWSGNLKLRSKIYSFVKYKTKHHPLIWGMVFFYAKVLILKDTKNSLNISVSITRAG